MKKAIFTSIFSVLAVGVVTATAVFLPTYVSAQGYETNFYNYKLALEENQSSRTNITLDTKYLSSTNVSLRDIILGTKSINNGTYIIYLGSEGFGNNRSFLYGSKNSNINYFLNETVHTLDSDFGKGMEYLIGSEFVQFNSVNNNLPVLTYIDSIQYADFEAQLNYETMIEKYKKLPYLKDDVETENLSEQQRLENEKKNLWARTAPSFSYVPNMTYKDWKGNDCYFRSSWRSAKKYIEITNFISKYFQNLTDINTSSGILIGYKNGKLVSNYIGSFSSTTIEGDSSSRSINNSNSFLSTWTSKEILLKNSFIDWLVLNFEK